MYMSYTASTEDDETSADDNIRIIIYSIWTDWRWRNMKKEVTQASQSEFFSWVSEGNIRKDEGACVLPGRNVEYIERSLSEFLQGGTICETNI